MVQLSRKQFLQGFASSVAAVLVLPAVSKVQPAQPAIDLTIDDIRGAAKTAGLTFTDAELKAILRQVQQSLKGQDELRKASDSPTLAPAARFSVLAHPPQGEVSVRVRHSGPVKPMEWASLAQLRHQLDSGEVTSMQLTQHSVDRLKKYGPKLRCLISLTEERAMHEAKAADARIKRKKTLSSLDGIPFGLKDLFAAKGAPTTWGAEPYRNQVFDYDSAVAEKLTAAGAVLTAKLSMGALAQGDVWFGGRTESPWDPKIGSSGSSAGSASAAAAGLLPFAIGTETSGSIVSPSHNCRVVGLRPTFGSVSRFGAMALSWTMDKAGPICRTAEDCAIVFAALLGADPRDPASISRAFEYHGGDIRLQHLKIGYAVYQAKKGVPAKPKQTATLDFLAQHGIHPEPVFLRTDYPGLSAIIGAESAASFDAFTRDDRIGKLKNSAWPNSFRASRLISAVDLIQADRVRRTLMEEYEKIIGSYDFIVVEDRGYPIVYNLNLTGHPQVLVPFGTDEKGAPRSFSLIGPAFSESLLLHAADQLHKASGYADLHPDLSIWD